MTPELRQRLLAYAKELVDAKVEQRKFFGGHRATVSDRLVSLDVAQYPEPEEEEDLYIRVWAEFTITQVSDPSDGYGSPGDETYFPYPSTTFSSPVFPVFTLRPPESEEAARQAQLDQMEYFLENALAYASPTLLLYDNSYPGVPLILAQAFEDWDQTAFPPFPPYYPGFPATNPELFRGYTIAGPIQFISDAILRLTVNQSATVTLYVRAHAYESLDNFSAGGSARRVRVTTRQVGFDQLDSPGGGGVPRQIAALQEAVVPPGGDVSFSYSPISTALYANNAETVSLVGFELL